MIYLKKKYDLKINDIDEQKIKNAIDYLNDSIEFSDKMLFNLVPIDKGMISFYSAAFYVFAENKDIYPKLKDFLEYLENKTKIIKSEQEVFEGYAMIYYEGIKQQGI